MVCLSHGFPRELRLVPSGAGEARTLRHGPLNAIRHAVFLPDGKRLVVVGRDGGLPTRLFVQDLPDGEPRPFTTERMEPATAVSPDGRFVAARAIGADRFALYPLDGGPSRPIPGIGTFDWPLRFSADGAALFVSESHGNAPTNVGVVRLDLGSGRKSSWLDFAPSDSSGRTGPGSPRDVDITPDGRSYVYSFKCFLSDLYIIEGLR